MGDRLNLFLNLAKHKWRPSGVANVEFQNALGGVIEMLVRDFSLAEAKVASGDIGPDFDAMFETVLSEKGLKALSVKWDPKRVVGRGISKGDLARDLRDLVHGRRMPFDPVAPSLLEFRGSLDAAARDRWLDDLESFG